MCLNRVINKYINEIKLSFNIKHEIFENLTMYKHTHTIFRFNILIYNNTFK